VAAASELAYVRAALARVALSPSPDNRVVTLGPLRNL
jgi:hypothetical protein